MITELITGEKSRKESLINNFMGLFMVCLLKSNINRQWQKILDHMSYFGVTYQWFTVNTTLTLFQITQNKSNAHNKGCYIRTDINNEIGINFKIPLKAAVWRSGFSCRFNNCSNLSGFGRNWETHCLWWSLQWFVSQSGLFSWMMVCELWYNIISSPFIKDAPCLLYWIK